MQASKAAVSWSGGKDSYLALHRSASSFNVCALFTMFTEDGTRSRSHGLRPEVLKCQADLLNLPLVSDRASWTGYEDEFKRGLRALASDGFSHVIFGDIFPDPSRAWAERVCHESGLEAVEPLWGEDTRALLQEFLATGAEAKIVATNAKLLDQHWLGKQLTEELLPRFEVLGVDACGERGEYHTFVSVAPRMTGSMSLREAGQL